MNVWIFRRYVTRCFKLKMLSSSSSSRIVHLCGVLSLHHGTSFRKVECTIRVVPSYPPIYALVICVVVCHPPWSGRQCQQQCLVPLVGRANTTEDTIFSIIGKTPICHQICWGGGHIGWGGHFIPGLGVILVLFKNYLYYYYILN